MLQNLLRTLNSFSKTTVLLICCCCLGCGNGEKEIDDPDRPDRPDGDEYEDIEVVDGKVRFYLSESENGIRRPMGVGERVWNESKVTVNGKPYAIATDENDRRYIDVAASNAGTYNATLTTTESGSWYDTSVYTDVKLPYSQFWTTTAQALQSYPMYGSYTKENGNKLIFDDAFAVLDVALTGSAEIASVKVASPDEEIVAGFANYLPSRGGFSMTEGVDGVGDYRRRRGAPRHETYAGVPATRRRRSIHRRSGLYARRRPRLLRRFRQLRLGRRHHGRTGGVGLRPDGRNRYDGLGNGPRWLCGRLRTGRLQQPRVGLHPVEYVG